VKAVRQMICEEEVWRLGIEPFRKEALSFSLNHTRVQGHTTTHIFFFLKKISHPVSMTC
jgi:hypothetical protein